MRSPFKGKLVLIATFGLLFLSAFSLPIIVSHYFRVVTKVENPLSKLVTSEDNTILPSIYIDSPGSFLRISHSNELSPKPQEDYLLSFWIYLKKFPPPGERITVLSKYESIGKTRTGFTLSFKREGTKLEPLIFLAANKKENNLYQFSQLEVSPRRWLFIGITLLKNRYLGLHWGRIGKKGKPEVQLLGGYELPDDVTSLSAGDLLLGSFQSRDFRGAIGPIGVFSKKNMGKELKLIFKYLVKEPTTIPAQFTNSQIKLWVTSAKGDESKYEHTISHEHKGKRMEQGQARPRKKSNETH